MISLIVGIALLILAFVALLAFIFEDMKTLGEFL